MRFASDFCFVITTTRKNFFLRNFWREEEGKQKVFVRILIKCLLIHITKAKGWVGKGEKLINAFLIYFWGALDWGACGWWRGFKII